MPYSSNLSEVEEPQSSDSLDTMLELSTETGRTTAVAASSSSEDQALLDPTLASSDSSWPVTPRQEGNGRLQNGNPSDTPLAAPYSGDHTEETAAAAASRPAATRHAEVRGQQHSAQNIDAAQSAAPARSEATAPTPPVDLLLILQQMQQQQQQMEQQMLALMQQLQVPGARPRPGHRDTVPPPPLHSTQLARPPLQLGDPLWTAPRAPRAPDVCRQCEEQEAHICLHSDAPSDRSGGSTGSHQH